MKASISPLPREEEVQSKVRKIRTFSRNARERAPRPARLTRSFAAAGLVLLVSWIMDVGLYEKQHADALRRDADLVI